MAGSRIVARRYAHALHEVVADAAHGERCLAGLRAAAAVLQDESVGHDVLANPTVPIRDVSRLVLRLSEALGLDATAASFLRVLAAHRRLPELGLVVEELGVLMDEQLGRSRGELVSAKPMPPEEVERIRIGIGHCLGRDVMLSARVEPALIEGIRVTVGDRVFDLSARAYLDRLQEKLLQNG